MQNKQNKPNKNVVIIVNLGSAENLTKKAIAKFLFQFLGDKRVVNLPRLMWYPILSLIIFFRSKKLLAKYQEISYKGKSPLITYTEHLADKLNVSRSDEIVLDSYLYGVKNKNINTILSEINQKYNVQKLVIVPLYPQYSSTTTAPVLDQVTRFYRQQIYIPSLIFINEFAIADAYIFAIVNSIRNFWKHYGKISKAIVLSFHALPIKLINKGDCYEKHCYDSFSLIKQQLQLDGVDVFISFQSKFGYEKWLKPTTMEVLSELIDNHYENVDIVAPGFICDCLETLEEIAISYKDFFEAKSKKGTLRYIPCLNDSENSVQMLNELINKVL